MSQALATRSSSDTMKLRSTLELKITIHFKNVRQKTTKERIQKATGHMQRDLLEMQQEFEREALEKKHREERRALEMQQATKRRVFEIQQAPERHALERKRAAKRHTSPNNTGR